MNPRGEEEKSRFRRTLILTLTVVAVQVGCLTLAIIFVVLYVGLWLDNQLDTRPLMTIILMIGSVPVTLVLMFWVVRKATARLNIGDNSITNPFEEGEDG